MRCDVTGDDLSCSSSRQMRSVLVLVRMSLMPFSPENEGTAVGSISASCRMWRMLVNEFDLWLLGWRIFTMRCADKGHPLRGVPRQTAHAVE